jgi:Glycosyltransferases involved in cell wall biogenesis
MIDFTVVIPTYNGASRIPDVLEKLRSQTGTENIAWEIIVVDNNSSDQTADVVQNMIASWHEVFRLRYVFEVQQGLAFARQRGVEESQGELIGFLDDDNFPDENWVLQAYLFGKQYPKAGAYGGQVHGDFEVTPPDNFDNIQGFLALRERGTKANLYQPEILSLPTGAGLVVRKKAWCSSVPSKLTLIGRVNNSMIGGEDWEALIYIYKAGWEIWYNPEMHLKHKIPAYRLQRDYLLKLIHDSCLCFVPLKMMVIKDHQKANVLFRSFLGNIYNLILYYLKYHNQSPKNLVDECEIKIYLSRIHSFFYWFKNLRYDLNKSK